LWCAATIAPLALWQWAPPFIDSTYGGGHQPFELLGLFLSLSALLTAAWHVRRVDAEDAEAWLVAVLWLLPVLAVIQQVTEHAQPSWDWKCYVGAADALRAGLSPYTDCYLYPPLFAQLLAGAYPVFHRLGEALSMMAPKHWMVVFFFWHSFQVLMVALCALLLTRLARREGMSSVVAAGVVAVLLVVDTPLQRTIRHNQVNLIVLNLVLLAADRLAVRSSIAGLLVAIAAHIKLLPAVLIGVMALERRWRAVMVAVGVTVGIAAVQYWGMEPAGMWVQFFEHAPQFVQGEYFRDNSPTGLMFNLVRVPVDLLGGDVRGWASPLRVLGLIVSLGLSAWVAQGMRNNPDSDRLWAEGLAMMLLLSPVAWEHHYVWALPLSVVAIARCWKGSPFRVGFALILIFGLPTFDVFPLSYHRLLGLMVLFATVRGSVRAVDRSG
jgi:hypothetical protein